MKYLTHEHSSHPSIVASLVNHEELASHNPYWTVEDVKQRRAVFELEHASYASWHCVATEDNDFAGICSLRSIDWHNKSGEMGVCLLPDFWHRAVTDQTHFIVLQHAFEELLLHRISFTIVGENDFLRLYLIKILGATHEGSLRESYLDKEGHYHNTELYSLLAPQWPDVKVALHRRIISAAEHPRHHHEHLII